jgi:enoyl-CoA hydratase/carnithine racemase
MTAAHARELELDTLTVEQDDRVLTVRFCDPPYNFMTARMQKDLDTLTAAADADISVGAVVLTGGVPNRYITHFDIAETLIGLTTAVGGHRLAQLIGPARALEMMLEGRMYSPQEAHHMGLVNRLLPRMDDLIDQAKEFGARYGRRNRDTVAAQKKVFKDNPVLDPAESTRPVISHIPLEYQPQPPHRKDPTSNTESFGRRGPVSTW